MLFIFCLEHTRHLYNIEGGGPQDHDSAEYMSLGTLQSHFIWKGELIGIF